MMLESLELTKEAKTALKDFVAKTSSSDEVLAVILYGSAARGIWDKLSDLDLLVLMSNSIRGAEIKDFETEVEEKFGVNMEVLILTPKEAAVEAVIDSIRRDGVTLHCKDRKLLFDILEGKREIWLLITYDLSNLPKKARDIFLQEFHGWSRREQRQCGMLDHLAGRWWKVSRTAYAFDPDVAGKVLLFLNKMSVKHKEYVLVNIGKAKETQLIQQPYL